MPDAVMLTTEDTRQAHRLLRMPILLLHVHTRCNCRCAMCDIWKRDESAELTMEALERQRHSLIALGVEHVVFTGGEPLMHREFASLISFFRQLNVRLTMLSSGLLLARYAGTIIQGLDDVIVSLDGPPAIHDRIRGINGAFQKLSDGVRAIRQLAPDFPIHARCTVQRANFQSLAATVSAAVNMGLNGISFLPADLSSSAFNRELIWPIERQNSIGIDERELRILEQQLDAVSEQRRILAPSFEIAESREKLQRIADHFRAEAGLIPHRAPRCNAPWVSGVWEVDGTLRSCFFHKPIGNLSQQSLEETLNSEAAIDFRSNLQIDQNETCRRCVCSLNYQPAKQS